MDFNGEFTPFMLLLMLLFMLFVLLMLLLLMLVVLVVSLEYSWSEKRTLFVSFFDVLRDGIEEEIKESFPIGFEGFMGEE